MKDARPKRNCYVFGLRTFIFLNFVFSEMEKPFPFQIYNAVGELVSKGIINVGGGRTDISVNICQLTRGWYYLGGTLSGQGLTTLRFFKR